MSAPTRLALALCLFCGMQGFACARPNESESRGELLYATHCNACHTTQIHWRRQELATDWNSLLAQVRRWQASIGLRWSEDEISDVARYLNTLHYGFPMSVRQRSAGIIRTLQNTE